MTNKRFKKSTVYRIHASKKHDTPRTTKHKKREKEKDYEEM